jgi:hypothetical protein
VASIPAVKALEGRYKARGLRVVSVTREDDRAEVEASAKEHGMDYPGFLDVDSEWSKGAGTLVIPAFVVIDKSGRLAYRHVGKLTEGTESFQKLVAVVDQALAR